jgi:16S rRNA (guanine527-N7)-methyltransferase
VDTAQIAGLLQPFLLAGEELLSGQLAQLSAYLQLLLRWNRRINLTAIREPEAVVTRHFGESIFAAQHLLAPDAWISVGDLGSGAGFPGLPLKIVRPAVRLALIESNSRKATFLSEAVRTLGLTDVRVLNARGESLPGGPNFELVTLRAVERFSEALPVAASLLQPGGRLGLLISSTQIEPARQLLPHYRWEIPQPIPQSQARVLLVASSH